MSKKNFEELAKEAIDQTTKGLNALVEVYELQEALKNLPKTESYQQLIKEICEKEKVAISFINRAILIERELMNKQHKAIQKIINNLP